MEIRKSISLNSQIKAEDKIIAHLSANISGENFSINTNVTDKGLMEANAESVKAQYSQFETEVKATATGLGYTLF